MSFNPTRTDREIFQIARSKAVDAAQLTELDRLFALLVELGDADQRSIAEVRAAKDRRGEKVRPLTKAEQEYIDDLTSDDVGLHELVRRGLEKKATAGEALKSIAYGLWSGVRSRRNLLKYYEHPEEREIELRLIKLNEEAANAFFMFIGDPEYRKHVEREVADMALRTRSGSALYVLLNVENNRDTDTNGKRIGDAFEKLEDFASELGVRRLSEFLGFGERGSGDWFHPKEGLRSVEALIQHVRKPSTKIKSKKALIEDLDDAAGVLRYAVEIGATFHIEIDD